MNERPERGLRRLDPLVGDWTMTAVNPHLKHEDVRGRVSFEWLAGGTFLIERWSIYAPEYPDGIAIIGADGDAGALVQHYFDSRGVVRTYEMTFEDGVWTLARHDEDFAQRFAARFDADGDTISGAWERSDDGTNWEHDFALTYERVR